MKKLFTLLLCALLAVSTLGAGLAETAEYVPTFPIVEEKATFTAATYTENMGDRIWAKAYEEATNVHIDWIYWSDPATQVGVTLAGGDLPDLFFRTGVDKVKAYQYGSAGIFVDYSEYLHLMPYMTELMDQYPESWNVVRNEDGSMYALPQVGISLTGNTGVIYMRTDMMEAAGLTEPQTVDEFYDFIMALQEANAGNPDFIAFQPYSSAHLSHLDYLFFPSFGEEVDIEFGVQTGSVVFSPVTEQYKRYLAWMNKIYNSGAYDQNIYTEDGTAAKARILENNCAVTTYGTLYSLDNFESGNYDVDVLAPLTSEWQVEKQYKARNVPSYMYMHMDAACEDKETLIKWVNSLYAQRDQQIAEGVWAITAWLGVEGTDWRYTDDTLTTYEMIIPEDYPNAGTTYFAEVVGYSSHMGAGIFYGLNVGNVGQLCKGMGTRDKLIPYNVTAFPSAFFILSEEENDVMAENYTDIKNYVDMMKAKFIVGEEDLESGWERYVAEIEKMGIADVVAVQQAAYDRYMASGAN